MEFRISGFRRRFGITSSEFAMLEVLLLAKADRLFFKQQNMMA